MTTKLGALGEPRLGIALIWLVPTKLDGKPNVMAPVTDEELEQFRQVTGVDAEDLTSRLQKMAVEYQKDPEAMRAELLDIAGGDARIVDFLVELMQTAQSDSSGDESEEEGGKVIQFRRPETQEEGNDDDDDGGGAPR
jgi:hypothetical protein